MTMALVTSGCSVRRIELDDVADLVLMCIEHARFERAEYDPSGKAALLSQALMCKPARLAAWVAQVNGQPVGYVAVTSEFSTWSACEFLNMDCLFVREGWRGNGVGAALFATIVCFAREQGHAQIQWQTPDWNTDAQRFYLREGAVGKTKTRFFFET